MRRAGQAELVLLDPAESAAGADENIAATGADPAGRLARSKARDGLRFKGGREPQGGVALQHKAKSCAGLDAEEGGNAEQEDH